MKCVQIVSVLALCAMGALACNDDEDQAPEGSAATTSHAGAAGSDDGADGEGGEASGATPPEPFELIGEYTDNFGGELVVTDELWGSSTIAEFDNEANVIFTQFPADAAYNPSKFAKTTYTEPVDGSFYHCMVVYDAPTLSAAKASTETPDASAPDVTGCGGFPWTQATAR